MTPREEAAAQIRRDTIAESTARLMAHAARMDWGEVEGLPTLTNGSLVFHFTGGRKGYVKLPPGSDFGNKDI